MNRPMLIAMLGYLLGIIWGLYFTISIVPFIVILGSVSYYFLYRNERRNRIKSYLKVCISKSMLFLFVSITIISYLIVQCRLQKYETTYRHIEQGDFIAIVATAGIEKEFTTEYIITVITINGDKKYQDTNLVLSLKKQQDKLEYGQQICFKGSYEPPQKQRNEGGFDQECYYRSKGLYGKVKASSVTKKGNVSVNPIKKLGLYIAQKIEREITKSIPDLETRNLLLGILLGNVENLSEETKEDFRNSSLAHILAVSGMHVSYVIMGITIVLQKSKINKRVTKIIIIGILIVFGYMTGFTASVKRAVIMSSLSIGAGIIYRKSDWITNFSLTIGLLLVENPFCIYDRGMWLSFAGALGICMGYPMIKSIWMKKEQSLLLIKKKTLLEKIWLSLKDMCCITVSAQIIILPIMMLFFNTISLTFLIANIGVSFLIAPILLLGFFVSCIPLSFVASFLRFLLQILLSFASFCSSLPGSHILVTTPKPLFLITYYASLIIIYGVIYLKEKEKKRVTEEKISYLITRMKNKIRENQKGIIIVLIFVVLGNLFYQQLEQDLQIYFIDVGQGDATLVITPHGKTMMFDSGGDPQEKFDIGKNTVLPFLLYHHITKIDYLCISHFDADHMNAFLTILDNLEVGQVCITMQEKESKEYLQIMKRIEKKKIPIKVVQKKERMWLDKVTYLDILYPNNPLTQKRAQ